MKPSFRRCCLTLGTIATLLVTALAGCGGGVGSGGTGGDMASTTFASGPITGFGSIIVNGVHYDESRAVVVDGDGNARNRAELKLGMIVDIDASDIVTGSSGATATANRVKLDSDLLGPVGAVDSATASLTVLGQRVTTDATTAIDPALGSLKSLAAGTRVEVWAVYDVAGSRYRATRIGPAAATAALHLRGPLAQLDTTAQSLRIGGVAYAFDGVGGIPTDLAVGSYVRLSLSAVSGSSGRWKVSAFGSALPTVSDGNQGSVKGLVSSFSSTAVFSVNGQAVDASNAVFPEGKSGLALGARVEVQGPIRSGVLRATQVDVRSDSDEERRGFELQGAIESVNAADNSFVVRGQAIGITRSDLSFSGGTAADLAVGRKVEVKGVLSADGLRIDATAIVFD